MKIVVTGGAGFIGSNLVELLVRKGHDVIVVDNLHTGSRKNLAEVEDRIEFIHRSCGEATSDAVGEIDGIFHIGIYSSSPMYREDPSLVGKAVNDFLQMLTLAKEQHVPMVWASSSSIYNGNPTPWKEDMPIRVKDYYTEARYAMERLADLHYDWHGTKTIGLRFFSVYGPKEEAKERYANLISQFLWSMQKGESPVIYGDGSQTRDFIHVADVTDCLLAAFTSERDHDIFNVGTGKAYDLNELSEIFNDVLSTEIPPTYVENPIKGYVQETLADTTKTRKELGFVASIELKEGIQKLIDEG
jgi:UDP-glucose 4-epimerase